MPELDDEKRLLNNFALVQALLNSEQQGIMKFIFVKWTPLLFRSGHF